MSSINDLHIEKEIFPLFDFTKNEFARRQLLQCFQWTNYSRQQIVERQEICRSFLAMPGCPKGLAYVTYDFLEVRQLLINDLDVTTLGRTDLLVPFYNSRALQKAQARLNQALKLLCSLHDQLALGFPAEKFPEFYRPVVQRITDFLGKFKLFSRDKLKGSVVVKKSSVNELISLFTGAQKNGETEAFYNSLFELEAYLSVAMAHSRLGLTFPEVGAKKFSLRGFFHPLLKSPVRNDFTAVHNVGILSGPNMSGKSTLLKSIGLCVYLSHLGFGIPATRGSIPLFDSITVAIDPKHDLTAGFSHFMTEVMNVKSVALAASDGKACFAVFDELFRGTNIEDALEIFGQTVRGLAQYKNSFFIISTHLPYFRSDLQLTDVELYYLDSNITDKGPGFSFELKPGWSDVKVGRLLFELQGIQSIFDRRPLL